MAILPTCDSSFTINYNILPSSSKAESRARWVLTLKQEKGIESAIEGWARVMEKLKKTPHYWKIGLFSPSWRRAGKYGEGNRRFGHTTKRRATRVIKKRLGITSSARFLRLCRAQQTKRMYSSKNNASFLFHSYMLHGGDCSSDRNHLLSVKKIRESHVKISPWQVMWLRSQGGKWARIT